MIKSMFRSGKGNRGGMGIGVGMISEWEMTIGKVIVMGW